MDLQTDFPKRRRITSHTKQNFSSANSVEGAQTAEGHSLTSICSSNVTGFSFSNGFNVPVNLAERTNRRGQAAKFRRVKNTEMYI